MKATGISRASAMNDPAGDGRAATRTPSSSASSRSVRWARAAGCAIEAPASDVAPGAGTVATEAGRGASICRTTLESTLGETGDPSSGARAASPSGKATPGGLTELALATGATGAGARVPSGDSASIEGAEDVIQAIVVSPTGPVVGFVGSGIGAAASTVNGLRTDGSGEGRRPSACGRTAGSKRDALSPAETAGATSLIRGPHGDGRRCKAAVVPSAPVASPSTSAIGLVNHGVARAGLGVVRSKAGSTDAGMVLAEGTTVAIRAACACSPSSVGPWRGASIRVRSPNGRGRPTTGSPAARRAMTSALRARASTNRASSATGIKEFHSARLGAVRAPRHLSTLGHCFPSAPERRHPTQLTTPRRVLPDASSRHCTNRFPVPGSFLILT